MNIHKSQVKQKEKLSRVHGPRDDLLDLDRALAPD